MTRRRSAAVWMLKWKGVSCYAGIVIVRGFYRVVSWGPVVVNRLVVGAPIRPSRLSFWLSVAWIGRLDYRIV